MNKNMKIKRYNLQNILTELDGTSTPVNVSYRSSPLRMQKRLTALSMGPPNWEKKIHKTNYAAVCKLKCKLRFDYGQEELRESAIAKSVNEYKCTGDHGFSLEYFVTTRIQRKIKAVKCKYLIILCLKVLSTILA